MLKLNSDTTEAFKKLKKKNKKPKPMNRNEQEMCNACYLIQK
jgi:hypothetical protein